MTDTGTTHGRRTFMKGIGASATAVAGIGAMSAPAQANIVQSAAGAGISGPAYLVGRVQDHFDGLGSDDDYQDAQADVLLTQAEIDFEVIKETNDQILTSIENLEDNAKSVAYQTARGVLLEELNEETSFAEAVVEAEDSIDEHISANQENLLDRWNTMIIQIEQMLDRGNELEDFDNQDLLEYDTGEDVMSGTSAEVVEYNSRTLENGDGVDLLGLDFDHGDPSAAAFFGGVEKWDDADMDITAVDGDPDVRDYLFNSRFDSLFDDLADAASEARSEIDEFADGIQDDYQAGDIDTEDITTPQDLWEMSSDDSDNPYAAADLSGLGLEINQSSSVVIEVDEEIIDGDVFLSQSPIGESLEVGLYYDPSISRSTDDDDEPDDDLDDYDGDSDDPVPIDGLVFVAYNTDDGSTYEQVEEKFEVLEAQDEDGEELESISYEPSTGQQTSTTDTDELRDELGDLNDELIRLEDQRAELATGGAGGFLADTNSTVVAAVLGVAGIWVIFGGDS